MPHHGAMLLPVEGEAPPRVRGSIYHLATHPSSVPMGALGSTPCISPTPHHSAFPCHRRGVPLFPPAFSSQVTFPRTSTDLVSWNYAQTLSTLISAGNPLGLQSSAPPLCQHGSPRARHPSRPSIPITPKVPRCSAASRMDSAGQHRRGFTNQAPSPEFS